MAKRRTRADLRSPSSSSREPVGSSKREQTSNNKVTNFLRKHHKWLAWAGGLVTVVLSGVLIGVLTPQAQRLAPVPQSTPAPIVRTRPSPETSPLSESPPTSGTKPLRVLSEEPILGDGSVWSYPRKIVLNRAQIQDATYQELYSLGGYPQYVDTQLVVQNKRPYPIRILDMRVVSQCHAPLTGSLIYAPPQGGPENVQVGFDLDSTDTEARIERGTVVAGSDPAYFAKYTRTINPGGEQVFNLLASTMKHSCTFRYKVTILDGQEPVSQLIGDGDRPFRVAAPAQINGIRRPFRKYSALYVGGDFIPFKLEREADGLVRVDPKTYDFPTVPSR